MYARRRIEEIIDMELTGEDAVIIKFAHNEEAPDMQLKYDIWCSTEVKCLRIVNRLNSLFGRFIVDFIDEVDDEYLASIIFNWESNNALPYCKKEDELVKRYLSKHTINLSGSFDEDLRIMSDELYTWGRVMKLSHWSQV